VFGASEVGFVKLNDRTKKLLFGNIRFENVEEGYDPGDGTLVLPDKDLWVICAVIPQSLVLGKASKDSNWAGTNALAYSLMNVYSGRMQSFIRSLGYQAYGGNGMIGANIGFGVMAGLGEYSRSTQLVSPYFGNMIRTILPTVTDLPVAETKPIDAGILQFCKTCKKCGSTCPSGAISMKDEPFWGGGDKPYQNEGLKGYYYNGKLCFNHVFSQPTNCGICQTVCPYNKMDKAFIHKVIKASISKMGSVPGVNKFIADMDDVFGYGLEDTEKTSVWDRDPKEIPLFGLDESRS
jgi:reductive dehalogenase